MYCYGTEARIADCRSDPWGVHDCESTEAAGVRCRENPPPTTAPPPTTTPRPKTPIRRTHQHFDVRITGGRMRGEGTMLGVPSFAGF